LLLLGVLLHCGYRGKIVWELWNVLCQLSFTILLSFLIFKFPFRIQLLISVALLILTEVLYRYAGIEGFDRPFVKGENFGSWMDMVLMGKINDNGWVAFNAIPTTAHTIWGVLAGKILQSNRSDVEKLWRLAIPGIIFLILGYSMDWTGLTPIIKRISTTSFVIASGGWCLIVLALCYWIADIKGYKSWGLVFVVVGMNPIFIYMFSNTVGMLWFNSFMEIFTGGLLIWQGASEGTIKVANALIVLGFEWYLCYWLFRRKIFIKI
jgi:predicted acyltransferase